MDPTVLAAIVSASVTMVSIAIAYAQWRRDVRVKLDEIRDTVSVELIKQRIDPYSLFMEQLEVFSSSHAISDSQMSNCSTIIQKALYNRIGVLASHNTRQIMLYVRRACDDVRRKAISSESFYQRLWALHLALRSDLGIQQPAWDTVVERSRLGTEAQLDFDSTRALIDGYQWKRMDYRDKDKEV